MGWYNKYEQRKTSENIDEELLPVAWHPKRWWDCCMPEDKKKEIGGIFYRLNLTIKLDHWDSC